MSSNIHAIHHVGLVVEDLDRSIYFYHDLLGLPLASGPTPWFGGSELARGVGVPDAKLRLATFQVGETVVELLQYAEHPAGGLQPPPNNSLGAAHICFRVADVRAAKLELESHGVHFYSDVTVVDDGPLAGWRWVYLSDPDGLTLELVEIAYDDQRELREKSTREYLRARPALADLEPGVHH